MFSSPQGGTGFPFPACTAPLPQFPPTPTTYLDPGKRHRRGGVGADHEGNEGGAEIPEHVGQLGREGGRQEGRCNGKKGCLEEPLHSCLFTCEQESRGSCRGAGVSIPP